MWYGNRRGLLDFGEGLSESTTAGRVQQWVVGVGFAGCLGLYSIVCMVSQRATFLRVGRPSRIMIMLGTDAVAVGLLYLSAALFMHGHWFWSAHPEYHGYAHLGKIVCLVGMIGSIGYLFYSSMQLV